MASHQLKQWPEDLHWKLKRSLVLQVETNDGSVRKHITDDDVAALVISE